MSTNYTYMIPQCGKCNEDLEGKNFILKRKNQLVGVYYEYCPKCKEYRFGRGTNKVSSKSKKDIEGLIKKIMS